LRRKKVQLLNAVVAFLKIRQWAKSRYLTIVTQNLLALKFKLADRWFSLSPCSPHTVMSRPAQDLGRAITDYWVNPRGVSFVCEE
jgi:hypothetical protein